MFTAWSALEFLASKAKDKARRQNIPLSKVEEKMLYFSEVEESLPDISEVSQKFQDQYDDAEYEAKIAKLLRSAYQADQGTAESAQAWKDARQALRERDYYLLTMLDAALQGVKPRGDRWKLFGASLLVSIFGVLVVLAFEWANEHLTLFSKNLLGITFFLLFVALWFLWKSSALDRAVGWILGSIERIADKGPGTRN